MAAAFFVDGHTEQRFIQSVCPGVPVQRLGINGNTVSPEAIAKRAATQIRLLKGRNFPIVVLVDHEGRKLTPVEFAEQIQTALVREGVVDEVRVCVARRMIENWILADAELIGWADPPPDVDSLHGAAVLKRVLGEYDKAGDGPALLKAARASVIAGRSPSFSYSSGLLGEIDCYWLRR